MIVVSISMPQTDQSVLHSMTVQIINAISVKDVLYSMLGPDLLGLTVAVRSIVG